ncbi:MAG TPA: HD domain-containing protein [Opitutaceae bacterium]|nr:HD domain-containing protein [Opitutaceae bacterium]
MPQLTVAELRALNRAGNPTFAGLFVVRKLAQRTAKNDNPFLVLELGDRTGSFSANIFGDSPFFAALKAAGDGVVVRLEAKLDYFQERLSPKISKIEVVTPEELAAQPDLVATLVESAPEDAAALWTEFETHIAAITHAELRATVHSVFEEIGEAFRSSPAAVAMHHAYRCGLLEHTTHMARAARALFPVYPEINADLALAGILLHDIGKTIEYEAGLSVRKSRRGLLQGHVVLGYQLARKHGLKNKLAPDLLERLEHIILSHQGELEWGAAVMAATPEAVFVSMVDNLDARMGMVQRALRNGGEADEFSEYLPGLKSPVLLRPPQA